MTAANPTWVYVAIIAAVTIAMLLALGLCRAAAKPMPRDEFTAYFLGAELPITRPDLDAEAQVVAEAIAITRSAS